MTEPMIKVEKLSKKYKIGMDKGYKTFQEAIINAVKSPFANREKNGNNIIWALKDVSFEVEKGEVVGIIGRNGSGKSTLLKILSRITEPTEGRITMRGRVASLLEVGTGFHPELTGRENIYLNGSILGMTKREIDAKFDEIVTFAEIEKFLDTPVKRYSSGMYVRLAFAVAAHMEPEILLVDEVLAVGDIAFQQKCLGKMEKVAGEGRTVLFVSHNMGSIGRLCQTALLLDKGRVAYSGDASQVIEKYIEELILHESEVSFPADDSKIMQIRSIRVLDRMGKSRSTLDRSLPFRVQISYEVRKRVEGACISFSMNAADGTRICESLDTDASKENTVREPGAYVSTVEFPGEILNSGSYTFCISLFKPGPLVYDDYAPLSFTLEDSGTFARTRPVGVLAVPLKWTTERCKEI